VQCCADAHAVWIFDSLHERCKPLQVNEIMYVIIASGARLARRQTSTISNYIVNARSGRQARVRSPGQSWHLSHRQARQRSLPFSNRVCRRNTFRELQCIHLSLLSTCKSTSWALRTIKDSRRTPNITDEILKRKYLEEGCSPAHPTNFQVQKRSFVVSGQDENCNSNSNSENNLCTCFLGFKQRVAAEAESFKAQQSTPSTEYKGCRYRAGTNYDLEVHKKNVGDSEHVQLF
jgi:hypothetical protein